MDTVGSSMSAMVPALVGMPHYNSDGYGNHVYVPWWMSDRHKELNFARGYHIECGGGYGIPGVGSFTGVVNRTEGYGLPMKQAIRDEYGTSVSLSGHGEMIPNEQSYCEIDPEMKDKWGIPVLRFHWQWSDHELNQVRHMQDTFRQILEGMGGRVNTPAADFARRGDHPRGRHRPYGRRSAEQPVEQVLSGSRGQEPVRRGRGAVRQQRRQESHPHHRGARVADGGIPRRGNEEGQCLTSRGATQYGGSGSC